MMKIYTGKEVHSEHTVINELIIGHMFTKG